MGERWHGLRFPFKQTAQSLFSDPTDDELINSSIKFILNTAVGEYITLPEFGSQLPFDLFEQNDFVLRNLVVRHVTDSLERWEPRIEIQSIQTVVTEHEIRLFLEYNVKSEPGVIKFFQDNFERESER